MNEVVEMIYQWHRGASIKGIGRSLGFDRRTIRKYVAMAQGIGVSRQGPFPEESELIGKLKAVTDRGLLRETPVRDLIAPYQDRIRGWLGDPEVTAKQVWRLFREETGLLVSSWTMKRYLRAEFHFGAPCVTVRIEVDPGSQAQVDFGYVGLMVDPETGRRRRTWAFIMTLSYSRHRFVRFVFRQDIPTWIDCHIRAFEFLGGIPASVVLDNLKSGVLKPDIYDPTLNRAYGELERHYGFVADPAKVRAAKHKGKVERAVPVVRKHLLAGRTFRDIREANERALRWSREEIGMEIHGTGPTRPFSRKKPPNLGPFPLSPLNAPCGRNARSIPIIMWFSTNPTTRFPPDSSEAGSGSEGPGSYGSFSMASSSKPTSGPSVREPG